LIVSMSILASYQALLDLAKGQQRALLENNLEQFFLREAERERAFEALKVQEIETGPVDGATQLLLRGLIDQILTVDQALEVALRDHQERTNLEIAKLQPGMNALHAYIQENAESSFFIDKNQ
jgi:ClpP class serine protease